MESISEQWQKSNKEKTRSEKFTLLIPSQQWGKTLAIMELVFSLLRNCHNGQVGKTATIETLTKEWKMSKNKEVKLESEQAAFAGLDFSEYANEGFDNVAAGDISIPFLKMLQKVSPEVDKTQPEYIAGAEQGDIINSLTKELYKDGITVIPCNFRKEAIEWKVKEKGGGLVSIHPGDTPLWNDVVVDDKNRSILPNGNQLNPTANHFVLYKKNEGEWSFAVISMTGTQLKKSKQWLGRMAQIKVVGPNGKFTPPMFSQFWKLKSISESNDKGSWMGWNIENAGFVSDQDVFREALEFYKNIQSTPRLTSSATEVKQITSQHDEAM